MRYESWPSCMALVALNSGSRQAESWSSGRLSQLFCFCRHRRWQVLSAGADFGCPATFTLQSCPGAVAKTFEMFEGRF